jgi:ribosomal protein S18 acetylase RimI-like enzyme
MSDQEVIVRRATAADIPVLVESAAGLFGEDAGTRDPSVDTDWPREHGAASFAAALGDPARLVLVAESGGRVVGHLSGSVTAGTAMRPVMSATLVGIHVRAAHRRSGAGARLVGAFADWAREQGARQAEVTAYTDNTDALRFYERHGFGPHTTTLRRSLQPRRPAP